MQNNLSEAKNYFRIGLTTSIFWLLPFVIQAQKKYELWYNEHAPNRGGDFSIVKSGGKPFDADWENYSLPIGNGYMGANIFGRTDTERIQLTENTLSNKGKYPSIGSLTSFAELFIDFNHTNITNYKRYLNLNNGVAGVTYSSNGIYYTREYFASYPDKVLVVNIKANLPGHVTCKIRPIIPYLRNPDTSKAKDGRTGKVVAKNSIITLSGKLQYFNIDYEGQIKVIPYGGKIVASNDQIEDNGRIEVNNADSLLVIISLGTNYQLQPEVFNELIPDKKLGGFSHPHEKVTQIINTASKKPYKELLQDHIKDYQSLFSRAELSLTDSIPTIPTDSLLANYKKGQLNKYLEELYFQFGRYLLISSSRKGSLPANLQGVWSQYDTSPWSSGYWHNVNVQMNYWHAFNTNLAELFTAYVDYNEAFRAMGYKHANNYIKHNNPAAFDARTGENGWAIGTGASAYGIDAPGGHSGPGTGGFTTKLFWDQYEFTRNKELLKNTDYPAMISMAKFLMKCVKDTLGYYLASPSSSPEQRHNKIYYQTVGCGFDQQMIYESVHDVKKAAAILHDAKENLDFIDTKINRLDPIQIGLTGQIKEYREEKEYGEFGEYRHRHISQLVGIYPGTIITSKTNAWLDAAKRTLTLRGHISTGWAMAHRLNAWARTKEGDSAYMLLRNMLQRTTYNNLWNTHPPFQIDGNFGGTAGIAEMLLQSHEGYIEPLPALPSNWAKGSYSGLVARGNFEIDVKWENSTAELIKIHSRAGENCTIKYPNIANATIKNELGVKLNIKTISNDVISFPTKKGGSVYISNIEGSEYIDNPINLIVTAKIPNTISLNWEKSEKAHLYRLYVAFESEPNYTLLKEINSERTNISLDHTISTFKRATFKVTALSKNGKESKGALYFFNTANY
jgi:alpha-L-fucosidase 2